MADGDFYDGPVKAVATLAVAIFPGTSMGSTAAVLDYFARDVSPLTADGEARPSFPALVEHVANDAVPLVPDTGGIENESVDPAFVCVANDAVPIYVNSQTSAPAIVECVANNATPTLRHRSRAIKLWPLTQAMCDFIRSRMGQ